MGEISRRASLLAKLLMSLRELPGAVREWFADDDDFPIFLLIFFFPFVMVFVVFYFVTQFLYVAIMGKSLTLFTSSGEQAAETTRQEARDVIQNSLTAQDELVRDLHRRHYEMTAQMGLMFQQTELAQEQYWARMRTILSSRASSPLPQSSLPPQPKPPPVLDPPSEPLPKPTRRLTFVPEDEAEGGGT